MTIDTIRTTITTLDDRPITVRVMTPNGYEASLRRYPVLYVNDGQDVFRDDQTFWNAESLRFEQYYQDYAQFLPSIIIVALEAPDDRAERTAQYSPYTKEFIVPSGKQCETHIEGKGKEYLSWMTGPLKTLIDATYRTRPEREYTGICGYSTGGLNSIYAALTYPHVFTRLIAMSNAVFIWMDHLSKKLQSSDYSHLSYVYLDVGTEESERFSNKEEYLEGAAILHQSMLDHGVTEDRLKYTVYPGAAHAQKEWRTRFPDAIRWVFQDIGSV
ncbi:MAG TPA: alpha/beta hydrolase-fold protein [Sphaerochaeta sp.]|nr:alpha/beta hydrolase-fold protein [Sphaerochaeta sp.]